MSRSVECKHPVVVGGSSGSRLGVSAAVAELQQPSPTLKVKLTLCGWARHVPSRAAADRRDTQSCGWAEGSQLVALERQRNDFQRDVSQALRGPGNLGDGSLKHWIV